MICYILSPHIDELTDQLVFNRTNVFEQCPVYLSTLCLYLPCVSIYPVSLSALCVYLPCVSICPVCLSALCAYLPCVSIYPVCLSALCVYLPCVSICPVCLSTLCLTVLTVSPCGLQGASTPRPEEELDRLTKKLVYDMNHPPVEEYFGTAFVLSIDKLMMLSFF